MLGRIIHETSGRVAAARAIRSALEKRARTTPEAPPFVAALRGHHVKVIAEIKRRSPSRGEINAHLDPASRAREYIEGGAAAISVLTEPTYFGGSDDDLVRVRDAVAAPVLRKDFIIDEVQIIEARAWGASSVLLIARAVPRASLSALVAHAREWGMEPLVEVRNETELDAALGAGARAIGVNSRDLETLAVDAEIIDHLIPRIPEIIVAVAESGIRDRAQVERAARAGADAILVGSALSGSSEAGPAVRDLARVTRRGR
ncbi:MAG: indole-3-glycerol phosphate synthase TrpC [Gemmatimonadaceae bacterium]